MGDKKKKRRVVLGSSALVVSLLTLYLATSDMNNTDNIKTDKVDKEVEETTNVLKKIPKSNPNLDSSVQAFLTDLMVKRDTEIQTIILDNFDSITGLYAYPFKVLDTEDVVSIDLGISKIEVPKQNVISYSGFSENVEKIHKGSSGLALVEYKENVITNVELYNLDYKFNEIQNSILKVDLTSAVKNGEEQKKEEKSYKDLTVNDWKGMALLTSRDIIAREMAPIFLVPNSSVTVKKDLQDTFYYIITGTLISSKEGETVLKTYEGKNIKLDFGSEVQDDYLNSPVWIHVVTQNGIIKNIEFQKFDGANLLVMSEGIIAYIGTSSVSKE